ncbi:Major facilitator superfamily domain general substrate transporter [Penicillium cf. griseofulvum]|nr:Major facilitator superfamily domain general substrate transporter [Penicillium cf. griseofulvum]
MTLRLLMQRARTVFHRMKVDKDEAASSSDVDRSTVEPEKSDEPVTHPEEALPNNGAEIPGVPYEELQHGIQEVEAVAETWSRASLIFVFINMWFLYFTYAWISSVDGSLSTYVASSFQQHSLSGLPTAIADAFSAAVFLPVAKMMDTWGRAEGFLLPLYCAANVFYYIGFGGMQFAVDVITADLSQLKNRALAYAFTSSPYIITAFAGPKVADLFYANTGWRWAYGTFAIIFPIVAAPLFFVLKFNLTKAKKENAVVIRENSGRSFLQSVWFWTLEFDLIGVFIFTAGLVLFELPFDIASEAPNGWGTGYIIAMIVVGFSMLFFFGLYEKYIAPTPLLPYSFLTNRTVVGACLLDATYQLSNYCWNNYFSNFLQVVNDLTIAEAGYIVNTFDMVSGVLLFFVGWAIRKTGRFKWLLYISVPLYIFAQGLMIYFRRPGQNIGYQVMCQIFISIAGSIFIIVQQLAILAAVDHQHIATALALLNVVGTIGDSAGLTISMAIWNNTYKKALMRYLPDLTNLEMIYEDVETQLSYAPGTQMRAGIQKAYGYTQVRMLSAGLGVMVLAFAWTIMIKNINLKKVSQVKGMVF